MTENKALMSPITVVLFGGAMFLFGFLLCLVTVTKSPDTASNTQTTNRPNKLANLNDSHVNELVMLSQEVESKYTGDQPVSAPILYRLMELPVYATYSDSFSNRIEVRAVINKAKADGVITASEFKEIEAVLIEEYKRSILPTVKPESIEETVAKL